MALENVAEGCLPIAGRFTGHALERGERMLDRPREIGLRSPGEVAEGLPEFTRRRLHP